MPVNGIVQLYKSQEKVVVKPQKDSEYDGYDIVIENIDGDVQYDNRAVEAGKPIGKATKARACVSKRGDKVKMHDFIYFNIYLLIYLSNYNGKTMDSSATVNHNLFIAERGQF